MTRRLGDAEGDAVVDFLVYACGKVSKTIRW